MKLSFAPFLLICSLAVAGEAPPPKPATGTVTATASPAEKPLLGIQIDEAAASLNQGASEGLPVTTVVPDGTAANMGVQPGDLLTTLNGVKMASLKDLTQQLAAAKVGDAVTVTVKRGAETKTLQGTMIARPKPKDIGEEIRKQQRDLDELRNARGVRKEPSLAELVEQLRDLEERLPEAAKRFKEQYPNGEFNIKIEIDIVSDKTAKHPVELGDPPKDADAPKKDAPEGAKKP
jgi:membrane-associated protease RseP (regulator of RpoE activity)